jgi:hypothetical protein
MATLKAKLFAAASVNAELQALLGTNPFRWWDSQLNQASAFPAVVVYIVSAPRTYVVNGRLSTYFARVQFTVYGTGNDSQNADAVVEALLDFLKGFNPIGVSNLPAYPNTVVGDRDGGIAQTQPLTYQRFIDAMIFNDENA